MTNQESQRPSVPQPAVAGLRLGLYLVFTYILWMYIPSIPFLSFLYIIALCITPYVSYRLMKSLRSVLPEESPFKAAIAWSYGTQTFFYAGFLLLIPCYYYFTKALPSQLPLLEASMQQVLQQNSEAKILMDQLYGGNPIDALYQWLANTSVWAYLWSTFSMNLFLGAVISAINALILRRK